MLHDIPEMSYAPRAVKRPVSGGDDEELSGVSLGRYMLLRKLGKGGMGVVYEAEDHLLNRRVAVKLLPHSNKPAARTIERFFIEAQVAARLNHPNTIGIFDIGDRSGNFYIVMELLSEQSLGGYLRKNGPLSWQEATRIAADCCAALHDAHLVGLVHRDIKPDNILCSPKGVTKVTDFGLVKELSLNSSDGAPLTQEDVIVGSPQYMSPEQCRSQPVDSRCDIYSLGATYYCMLTGKSPFGNGAPMMLMVNHISAPVPDPRQSVPDLPQGCVDIIERAMQKEPDERFSTAEQMGAELENLLSNMSKFTYAFLRPTTAARQPARQRRSDHRAAEKTQDGESSDERRVARLEAALAQAPTAPILRLTKAQVWRFRYGKPVLIAATVLIVLITAMVSQQFGRLLSVEPVVQAAVLPPIKVGIVHSLSGPLSPVAHPVVDATLLAIDELNEQGGLLGRAIDAVVVDGQSEAETFAAAAEQLVKVDKVQAIFGALHSDGRRGVRQVVETYDQLLLYPGDSEGLEVSPNVFYLGGVPAQRIEPALRYSVQKLGYKRFYLLGSDVYYSRALSAELRDRIVELGGKVVGERLVPRDAPDYPGVLKKIASADPELIVSTLRGEANVYFFRAWEKRENRLEDTAVMALSLDENILSLLAGTDVSQNYVAGSYFQAVARPENAAFIAAFHKKYGDDRVITEAMEAAYSSVYLWAQAVRAAGDSSVQPVRLALKKQTLKAPSATYRFDENTNYAWKRFYLARIIPGNQLELIPSSPALIAPQLFPASRTRPQWEELYGRM